MANFPFKTITERQFELFSGNWLVVVNSPGEYSRFLLRTCFGKGKKHVGYSTEQIGWLVSTVGASRIEARFVCQSLTEPNSFAVVLFAVDSLGNRISAYYLADGTEPLPPLGETPLDRDMATGSGQGAIQVPHYMVVRWLSNWRKIWADGGTGPKRQMFANRYGTLQGYSYSIGDLLQSLFQSQPAQNIDFYMLFSFCLHDYKKRSSKDPGKTRHTFGMVVRLYDNSGRPISNHNFNSLGREELAMNAQDGGDDAPPTTAFYDMSVPRPPYGNTSN